MRRFSTLALVLGAVFALAGVAGASAGHAQIRLAPLNNSGETGTATLVQQADGSLLVTVLTRNGGAVPQPAHIHTGGCTDGGGVAFRLQNVTNGKSVTKLERVRLADLASSAHVVNIHKSTSEMGTYTACGQITI
jgi:hypothetical protein